ncbi:hypothetical protein Dda_5238 [Drechslerella dactyloides]|uniref:Nucleotide-diphospho-sugar transferase domain-containing protein n=1 Tax=Drechslerella dactyloides TaxID=74499 RepID=A0AAD6NIM2_DREDA|nr:hypothetical protein Dda_5238 [Drechslerella dactyloides]
MDTAKKELHLNSRSPTMMRRLRTPFLAFCLLTLSISTYLLWNFGTTLPRVLHGNVDTALQGGFQPTPSAAVEAGANPGAGEATGTSSTPAEDPSTLDDGPGLDQSGSTNLPYFDLVWWLRSIGRIPGEPLVFMIARNTDMALTFNMHETLEKFGRQDNFFVLCLEKACLEAPEVFTYNVVGMHKSSVKIAASIQLLREGFNFVFIDPDVYLTGSLDPFAQMAPLSDSTWDIQFFPGPEKAEKGLDASFFWARPSKYTKQLFKKVRDNWSESGDADINSLMNIFAFEMSGGAGTLKLSILDTVSFKAWGDFIDWEQKYFNNKVAINALHNKTAVVHLTCVEPSLRTYIARNFGAWFNVENYYTGKRKFLAIKGLEGDVNHASRIIGFALKVAMDTHRTLIFPSSAILTQARKNNKTGAADYVTVPEFPAYRIIDPASLDNLDIHIVESMYLNNRARYTKDLLSEDIIIMGNGHSVKDPLDGKPVVVREIIDKPEVDIVWLDMGSGRWWDLDASGNMAKYTKDVQSVIRTCGNANEEFFACNKRCV